MRTGCSAAVSFRRAGRAVYPGFKLDEPARPPVIEICRRLDGIALAIELAAARMVSMSAEEVRDRLGDRFRLLAGARRGLERHQTLRQAVAWSYDLLELRRTALLRRCSVFADGFDLDGDCRRSIRPGRRVRGVGSAGLLRAQVHGRHRTVNGHTRTGMLETIRQFAEEQLVASGLADETHGAHARYFAGREADITGPVGQPAAARGLHVVLHRTRESAGRVSMVGRSRQPGRGRHHRHTCDVRGRVGRDVYRFRGWKRFSMTPWPPTIQRSGFAYTLVAQSFLAGRIEEAVGYSDAGQRVIHQTSAEVPFGLDGWIGAAYMSIGQTDRWVEWSRAQCERDRDTHGLTRAGLSIALMMSDRRNEAMAVAADGLIEVVSTTESAGDVVRPVC